MFMAVEQDYRSNVQRLLDEFEKYKNRSPESNLDMFSEPFERETEAQLRLGFEQLDPDEQREFAGLTDISFLYPVTNTQAMPEDRRVPLPPNIVSEMARGRLSQLGGIANLQQRRRFEPPPPRGPMGGQSIMARLENVDNNVQQIARQLGVQNQPQRPNLPSAFQPMQGKPQGILGLLQQRQQQMAQPDPLALQQNMYASQQRLQPTYNPQARMMQQAMPRQAIQSAQAYRGLAAGPFAFSMRR